MLAALGLPAPASAEAIVARVGPKVVSYQSYRHWLHVGELGGGFGGANPRIAVMQFLISSYWVIDEAARLNVRVTSRSVGMELGTLEDKEFKTVAALDECLLKERRDRSRSPVPRTHRHAGRSHQPCSHEVRRHRPVPPPIRGEVA